MKDAVLVLDASVVVKWFRRAGERHVEQARTLRASFGRGDLEIVAPPLLPLELITVAGRRWHWERFQLERLAAAFEDLGIELVEPDLGAVARWTASGLTAYDAAYVAVADEREVTLVTDDEQIVAAAPGVAVALAAV